MYYQNRNPINGGAIFGLLLIGLLVFAAADCIYHLPTHKHVKIEKLKNGRYAFEDNDIWWYYTSDGNSSVVKNANGTVTFPRGGTWAKGEKPEEEEIEEIDEANIAENSETGDVESDATADSSAGSDGGADGGGDGGDGGGGWD